MLLGFGVPIDPVAQSIFELVHLSFQSASDRGKTRRIADRTSAKGSNNDQRQRQRDRLRHDLNQIAIVESPHQQVIAQLREQSHNDRLEQIFFINLLNPSLNGANVE